MQQRKKINKNKVRKLIFELYKKSVIGCISLGVMTSNAVKLFLSILSSYFDGFCVHGCVCALSTDTPTNGNHSTIKREANDASPFKIPGAIDLRSCSFLRTVYNPSLSSISLAGLAVSAPLTLHINNVSSGGSWMDRIDTENVFSRDVLKEFSQPFTDLKSTCGRLHSEQRATAVLRLFGIINRHVQPDDKRFV